MNDNIKALVKVELMNAGFNSNKSDKLISFLEDGAIGQLTAEEEDEFLEEIVQED